MDGMKPASLTINNMIRIVEGEIPALPEEV